MARNAKVVIRKYGNRRLYDSSASRYVNLEDIAALIRKGTEVQVVDAKTGEDLTRVTLTQIIVEDAKEQPGGLPVEVLRHLIVASDHVRQEFMKSAVDTYQKMQNVLQTGLGQVGSAALSPLETVRRLVQGPEKPAEASELQELRQRLAELEARVGKPKRTARKNKSSR